MMRAGVLNRRFLVQGSVVRGSDSDSWVTSVYPRRASFAMQHEAQGRPPRIEWKEGGKELARGSPVLFEDNNLVL